jgi:transcriptional regulator with XRE-family HTH domain
LLTTFGDSLRGARTALRMSQYQLADTAQVNRSSITTIEAGRQNLTFETAGKLARAVVRPLLVLLLLATDRQVRPDGYLIPRPDRLAIELTQADAIMLAGIGAQIFSQAINLLDPATRRVVLKVTPAATA